MTGRRPYWSVHPREGVRKRPLLYISGCALARLRGAQVKAGLPWQVVLEPETIATLRAYVARVRRLKRCKKEAS